MRQSEGYNRPINNLHVTKLSCLMAFCHSSCQSKPEVVKVFRLSGETEMSECQRVLAETESDRSAERWANEMTDPGSSGGHSQSYSSSRKKRGETKSCDMQSICEAKGRLQIHTGGKTNPTQLQLPPNSFSPSRVLQKKQKRLSEEGLSARTLRLLRL
ncbi:hypothetical protein Q8A73_017586 [Channa argus]|nr:hypothetical protein Q8A73_017586 [Channa argus]